jgi:hypothetical protein
MGRIVNDTLSEIPDAYYKERDFNNDGEKDDYIYIPVAVDGDYQIVVDPEPDANPDDTYSLFLCYEGGSYYLDENQSISEIPTDPYVFTVLRPDTPIRPNGKNEGGIGNFYNYKSKSNISDNSDLYYLFNWSDGNYSNWLGPYESGEEVIASYSWSETGSYNVSVLTRSDKGFFSEWSDPLTISITTPRNKPLNYNIFSWLLDRFPLLERLLTLIRLF